MTQVDLYNKRQADAKFAAKANVGDSYTKAQEDALLAEKADVGDFYTKAQTDALIEGKADVGDSYTKAEEDQLLAGKVDVGTLYSKSEVNALLDEKADIGDSYTKAEEDTLLGAKQDTLHFDNTPARDSYNPVTSDGIYVALQTKMTGNSAIIGATKCKITYDSKGLVTSGTNLEENDIPDLGSRYIKRSETTGTIGNYNPVALKDYVDQAISTSTATFLGTYDAHDDLGLTVVDETDPTNAQIAAAIASQITFPTGFPSINDYVFIQLDFGETGNANEYRRFKFRGLTWAYEYTLNSSTFTETQWAAINSGVTAAKVGAYDAYATTKQDALTFDGTPTNGSSNPVTSDGIYDALALKQDALTFDSAPTSASTNPVTSGGVYTALSGKQNTLTFDQAPTAGSDNPVTSNGIKTAMEDLPSFSVTKHSGYSTMAWNSTKIQLVDHTTYYSIVFRGDSMTNSVDFYNKTQSDALLANKQDTLTFDTTPTEGSANPVTSGGMYTAMEDLPSFSVTKHNGYSTMAWNSTKIQLVDHDTYYSIVFRGDMI